MLACMAYAAHDYEPPNLVFKLMTLNNTLSSFSRVVGIVAVGSLQCGHFVLLPRVGFR